MTIPRIAAKAAAENSFGTSSQYTTAIADWNARTHRTPGDGSATRHPGVLQHQQRPRTRGSQPRQWPGHFVNVRILTHRLHLKIGQQAGHEPGRRATRFHPGEPARERAEYLVQNIPPTGNVYAVTSGHRKI
jgi:hypothetical protein